MWIHQGYSGSSSPGVRLTNYATVDGNHLNRHESFNPGASQQKSGTQPGLLVGKKTHVVRSSASRFARTCAGFSDASMHGGAAGLKLASEKRQGTKSREMWQSGAAGSMGIEAGRRSGGRASTPPLMWCPPGS